MTLQILFQLVLHDGGPQLMLEHFVGSGMDMPGGSGSNGIGTGVRLSF